MSTHAPILLRHATCAEQVGQCVGQLDIPLDATGRATVAGLHKRWPDALPQQIFCSDLRRARETAAGLLDCSNTRLIIDDRLREIRLGEWQGKHWDYLYKQNPEQMDHWGRHWLDKAPPGGETGSELFDRVYRWWCDHRELFDGASVIVAHAGSLRALACLLQNRPAESMFDYQFHHCSAVQILPVT